jgi:putative methyltransferase (TIGR04325 family)
MTRHYCTYFDERYFPRGMAMIHSLQRYDQEARITVLCLSAACEQVLRKFATKNLVIVTLSELEKAYPELSASKENRSLMEYYFTCTPFLIHFALTPLEPGSMATYLDADLWFFGSPQPIYEEIGTASIAITPHRFPEDLSRCEQYGIYNVGWVSFRNDTNGLACLNWWKERCAEWCYDFPLEDRFADQKYLDQFSSLFESVHSIQHPGANLAPWNVRNHLLSSDDHGVRVDAKRLIFFHFHGFKFPEQWLVRLPFKIYGASLSRILRKRIIRPYLGSLNRWERHVKPLSILDREGLPESALSLPPKTWKEIDAEVRAGNYLLRGPRYVLQKALALFRFKRRVRAKSKGKPKSTKPKNASVIKVEPTEHVVTDAQVEAVNALPISPPDRLFYRGDFESWEEACSQPGGYDAPLIFETTRAAIRKVVSGEALFERDSVIFSVPEYPFSTIAGLLHVACANGRKLSVVDVGGSLGSVYFSCRPWLNTVSELKWSVVEQAHYVECGRQEFTTASLTFHHTLEESIAWNSPDVVLLSGALQFFSHPLNLLDEVCASKIPFLFIERNPFWEGERHRIVIQHVPAEIYAADYASWLFSEKLLLERLSPTFEVVTSYPAMDVIPLEDGKSYFKGMLLRRRHSDS